MDQLPPCSGLPPLHTGVADAVLGRVRFGVFSRRRSLRGADAFPRGLPTRGARPVEQVPLADALRRRWEDDRHIVLYTADQPFRINNAAVSSVRAEVRLVALDVDNHDDAPGWMAGERAKIVALLSAHPGGFVHTTKRGWRALFALPSPFPIRSEADKEGFALLYARLAGYLYLRFGIVVDDALTRWNQPVRLPHVVRGGRVFDAEVLAGDPDVLGILMLPDDVATAPPDLGALAAVHPRWGGVARRWDVKRRIFRIVASPSFDGVPLPPRAERLAAAEAWAREEAPRAILHQRGRATARSVAATLHVGFALEREDVARILTGTYNRRRCSPPWSEEELEDLRGIAYTVARSPKNPVGFLLTRDRTGVEAARATLAAAAEARRLVRLEDAPSRIIDAIEQHRAIAVRATCGAGKTHVVARYIAKRTAGRVVVVVPRHELARGWVASLAAAGEHDVAYHASVVQRRDEAGRRHCDNKVALRVYRHGGDVARDVCPSCPRQATCPAYATRAEAKARVHVVPREMVPKLEITDEDLVVFDDAAVDLLAWYRLRVSQLRRLGGIDPRLLPKQQGHFLQRFVDALLAGPRSAEESARRSLASASSPPPAALQALAERAVEGQRSPRLARDMLAQGGSDLVETLRDVDRLRQVLRFAEACAEGASIDWGEGSLGVHGETAAMKLLRNHGGRLVVLDAAANVEELHSLRPDLHIERLDLDDAGDARRVLLFTRNATRTALRNSNERKARLGEWLTAALERLSARRALRPVFVVYKSVEADVREHPILRAWCAANPRRDARVVHFGALRGSNRFRRCDAVVTLGDPWLNGDDVVGRAARLALDEPAYRIALVTAELGQAHGRSRSVRRPRRLTHVHVGRLVPDGWAAGVDLEPLDGPSERSAQPQDRLELRSLVGRLGGNRATAAALGCSPSAVANWASGSRRLPFAALDKLRTLVTQQQQPNSVSSGEAARGARPVMDTVPCVDLPRECVHRAARAPELLGLGHVAPAEEAGRVPTQNEGPQDRRIKTLPEESPPGNRSDELSSPGTKEPVSVVVALLGSVPPSLRDVTELVIHAQRGLEPFSRGASRDGPCFPRSGRGDGDLTFEDELALLAQAQAHARRRLGSG